MAGGDNNNNMFLRERGKPIAESQVESLYTHDGRMQKKVANPLLKAISPEVLCQRADSELCVQ